MNRSFPLFMAAGILAACSDQGPVAPEVTAPDFAALETVSQEVKPGSGGPYAVGFTTFMVYDDTRGDRPIPVYVWYPVDPAGVNESSPQAMYPLGPFVPGAPVAASSAFEAYGFEGAYQEPVPAEGPFS
jgi:hypothetical protein